MTSWRARPDGPAAACRRQALLALRGPAAEVGRRLGLDRGRPGRGDRHRRAADARDARQGPQGHRRRAVGRGHALRSGSGMPTRSSSRSTRSPASMVDDLLDCPEAALALDDLPPSTTTRTATASRSRVLGLLIARRAWQHRRLDGLPRPPPPRPPRRAHAQARARAAGPRRRQARRAAGDPQQARPPQRRRDGGHADARHRRRRAAAPRRPLTARRSR